MDLTPIVQSIASAVGCPTTYVEILFRDFGADDGGFVWHVCVNGIPGKRPELKAKSTDFDLVIKELLQKVETWRGCGQ